MILIKGVPLDKISAVRVDGEWMAIKGSAYAPGARGAGLLAGDPEHIAFQELDVVAGVRTYVSVASITAVRTKE